MRRFTPAAALALAALTPATAAAAPAKFEGVCPSLQGTANVPAAPALSTLTLTGSGTCAGTLTRKDGVKLNVAGKQAVLSASRTGPAGCQFGGSAAQLAGATSGNGTLTFHGVYPVVGGGAPGNETITFDVASLGYGSGFLSGVFQGGSEAGYPAGTSARLSGNYTSDSCAPADDRVDLRLDTGPSAHSSTVLGAVFTSTTG